MRNGILYPYYFSLFLLLLFNLFLFYGSTQEFGQDQNKQNNVQISSVASPRVIRAVQPEVKASFLYYPVAGNYPVETSNFGKPPLDKIKTEPKEDVVKPGKLKEDESILYLRENAVKTQREQITKEMVGYQYQTGGKVKLNDLIMEKGGKPIRNIIVTTWRSGSSFLEATIASHPSTFSYYEPLQHFEDYQVRSGKLAKEGLRVITNQLSCNFTEIPDFMAYNKTEYLQFNQNTRVWDYCRRNQTVCTGEGNDKFMSNMCKLFPFQIMKTVRFRLKLAKELLKNKDLDVRILLLVRDPRGIIKSRDKLFWCALSPDCYNPNRLCIDLEDDFAEAELLREEYPDRFLAIRYEDLSLNIEQGIAKILKFFRLQFHPKVLQFLESHTSKTAGGIGSLFRDSKNTPFRWRGDIAGSFYQLRDVQEACSEALKKWGYAPVANVNKIMNFNPLLEPPWPEMNVSLLDNK